MNHSYGLQLPRIPAAWGDVSGFKALALGAAVTFFDTRNRRRTGDSV